MVDIAKAIYAVPFLGLVLLFGGVAGTMPRTLTLLSRLVAGAIVVFVPYMLFSSLVSENPFFGLATALAGKDAGPLDYLTPGGWVILFASVGWVLAGLGLFGRAKPRQVRQAVS